MLERDASAVAELVERMRAAHTIDGICDFDTVEKDPSLRDDWVSVAVAMDACTLIEQQSARLQELERLLADARYRLREHALGCWATGKPLTDEMRRKGERWHCTCGINDLVAKIDALQELERDAARYRWLRTRINYLDGTGGVSTARSAPILTYRYRNWTHTSYAFEHDTIDAYIDAALAADAGKPL
jgi:hypothetical protein